MGCREDPQRPAGSDRPRRIGCTSRWTWSTCRAVAYSRCTPGPRRTLRGTGRRDCRPAASRRGTERRAASEGTFALALVLRQLIPSMCALCSLPWGVVGQRAYQLHCATVGPPSANHGTRRGSGCLAWFRACCLHSRGHCKRHAARCTRCDVPLRCDTTCNARAYLMSSRNRPFLAPSRGLARRPRSNAHAVLPRFAAVPRDFDDGATARGECSWHLVRSRGRWA